VSLPPNKIPKHKAKQQPDRLELKEKYILPPSLFYFALADSIPHANRAKEINSKTKMTL